MQKLLLIAAGLALVAGAANARAVTDATGDFLSGYTGPKLDDLDIVGFSVTYDRAAQMFDVGATFVGNITAGTPGFYVVGVNTGTGVSHPFGPVGQGNVLFNQAFTIQKNGAGAITVPVLGSQTLTATISGKSFDVLVPLADLPTTGFDPSDYGFNLWSRQVTGGLAALADFAPENATISTAPEPAAWAMLIVGFGLAGAAVRRRRAMTGSAPA